jgi:transcriptional regulator with XRE-family HTH domain
VGNVDENWLLRQEVFDTLRALREESGLTQEEWVTEVSKKTGRGIDQGTASKWLGSAGGRMPGADVLLAAMTMVGVDRSLKALLAGYRRRRRIEATLRDDEPPT